MTTKRLLTIAAIALGALILAVAIYFGLQITSPIVRQSELSIEGPERVAINRYAQLWIKGSSVEELARGKLIDWPREGTQVIPAMTWSGEPFLLVAGDQRGEYLVAVCVPSSDDSEALDYAEHVLAIGEPDPKPDPPDPPDPPEPDENPYPAPLSAWRATVEPIRALTLPRQASEQIGRWYAEAAEIAGQPGALSSTADLRAYLVDSGKSLNLRGQLPEMAAAHDAVLAKALTLDVRPLDHEGAEIVLMACAWAAWEAGH